MLIYTIQIASLLIAPSYHSTKYKMARIFSITYEDINHIMKAGGIKTFKELTTGVQQ